MTNAISTSSMEVNEALHLDYDLAGAIQTHHDQVIELSFIISGCRTHADQVPWFDAARNLHSMLDDTHTNDSSSIHMFNLLHF